MQCIQERAMLEREKRLVKKEKDKIKEQQDKIREKGKGLEPKTLITFPAFQFYYYRSFITFEFRK